MIRYVIEYAKSLNARDDVFIWLKTTGNKYLKIQKVTTSELEHIIDFFMSDKAPQRLLKMSLQDAKRKAKEWSEASQKKGAQIKESEGDIEPILTFDDGSKIVKLITKSAYQREGFLMSHCLGGYSLKAGVDIYSYRDNKNLPHATF